ncbi:MAG: propane 2-monooxygenase small subunit [Solirubrobacteraceae bacterium]|jgi:propane monooxygenase small subunit|nr:propane 2-monooxygenase small subunit [Solirubrobacteraceae bacterium]
MATETPTKERSVPKPQFTDAEAGAREFPSSTSRIYNYFTPAKRKASVYEDVTVDVQPDPARHLTQGWIYGFADGTMGYPAEWTALKSSDWHLFLDPNEEWEQTIYRNNADVVQQNLHNLANAKAARAFSTWGNNWTRVVERHVGAWAHAEQGIGLYVYLMAQRDAPTNMINNALAVASLHKLRFAQDLILYNLDLSDQIEGFDGGAHKEAWQSDPVWQGVRENVESLTAIRDWAEAWFATAVVFEPLVGELFRSEFVMQIAAPQRDFVTPTLMGAGESDVARDQRGARALFSMLVSDDKHAEENRETLQGWLDKWTPVSVAAAQQLQPIWSQVAEKVVRFDESRAHADRRFVGFVEEFGLTPPKELDR